MEWKEFAANFGLPGLMLAAMAYVIKMWIASNERTEVLKVNSNERTELARLKVEDKKADAMTTGFAMLAVKIDSHHTDDLQSHSDLAERVENLHGKLDGVFGTTPVRGVPVEPPPGGYYAPNRPKTQGGR